MLPSYHFVNPNITKHLAQQKMKKTKTSHFVPEIYTESTYI